MRNRIKRRQSLLERFRASSRERLSSAMLTLAPDEPSRAGMLELRQSLTTMQGEAHMLGLASLSALIDLVLDELAGKPAPTKIARTLIGVELLREYFEEPLVQDEAAVARLGAARAKLNSGRARPSGWAEKRAALDHVAS